MEIDEFAEQFSTFQRTAYRVEMLPQYLVDGEAEDFARYKAGAPLPLNPNADWNQQVRDATERGRRYERVHVLPESLTPYLRFEIDWGYLYSATAGERIGLVLADAPSDVRAAAAFDFWLFDDSTAVRMVYEPDGRFLRPEPADADSCRAIKHILDPHVVTLDQYLRELRNA